MQLDSSDKNSKERQIKSHYMYRGKRINVKLVDIMFFDGKAVRKEIVEHPGAVVILPLLDGKVILLKQYRTSVEDWIYELPAGTLDRRGESVKECARRELKEETGYVAERLKELFRLYPSPGFCTEIIHSFLAKNLKKDIASPEEGEIIQPIALPFEESLELVRNQRIIDAKTISTLLYYDKYIRKQ